MLFCDQNQTVISIWIDHGFGHCFLDTASSIVVASTAVLLGSGEIHMYWRHGTPVPNPLTPISWLYRLQLTLLVLLAILPIFEFTIWTTVIREQLYGHLVLWNIVQTVSWIYVIVLIYWERAYDLPSPPSRGHGMILLIICALIFISKNLTLINFNSPAWWFQLIKNYDHVKLGIFITEYILCFLSFAIALKAPGIASLEARYQFAHKRLLDAEEQAGSGLNDATAAAQRRSASEGSTFSNFWSKVKLILPYLWPKGHYLLQLRVLICIGLLAGGRVVNVYVPILSKWIVNSLTYTSGASRLRFRWDYILIYVSLRCAQGGAGAGGGLFNILRSFMWIRIQQFTTREIQVRLYSHLHSLSMRWHLGRKTGEVLRVMDRGTNSISSLLSYILFQIMPTIVDITIAIIYFTTAFNAWFGLIVTVTMVMYLCATIGISEWRTKFKRKMNRLDNETQAKGVDSLLNFETVKYYNAESYEVNRYREALLKYQDAEWLAVSTLSLLNLTQNVIINLGLMAGSLLCAHMVVMGTDNFTVGDYVLFATYIMQLYQPLNFLGTYYRMIQQAFIDMENMFDLLNEEQEVKDPEHPKLLTLDAGRVELKNVHFHYVSQKPILKGISFVVEPGKTVALVGPSGSGKSTIIRLLFRFYDIQSGSILFDGQNITAVTQRSLRQLIGVVPQDTVLFNDTILYNVRYGRTTANDTEVQNAARAAEIHDKIETFPDGYSTMVGERGLKLSGGEKQRVAIARTILKAPAVILLDEATSALDTKTERSIQASLSNICAGKTTIIVAHRLSTVIHADEILVLKDGEIVERGRHDYLVSRSGIYADMWSAQLQNSASESQTAPEPPGGERRKKSLFQDSDSDNDVS